MGEWHKRLSLGGLIVLLALLIGCGGDDEPSNSSGDTTTEAEDSSEPAPVTKADLSKEAKTICDARDKELDDLLAESDKAQASAIDPETLTSVEATEKAATEVARIQDELAKLKLETTKELSKLEAPEPALLEDFVETSEQYAAALGGVADAWRAYAKNPTQENVEAITTAQEAQVKASAADQKAAEKLSLKQCSQTAGPVSSTG